MRQKYIPVVLSILLFSWFIGCSNRSGGGSSDDQVPGTYSISGTVNGDIRQGVNIVLSGDSSANGLTDAEGYYSFSGLSAGSFTVTPAKAGYTFTQSSRPVTISAAESSGNDFTAAAVLYTISGTVDGGGTPGATVTASGTTEGGAVFGPVTTTTSGTGTYSLAGVPNGDYVLAVTKPGYLFIPASQAVTIAAADAPNHDFSGSLSAAVAFRSDGGTGDTGSGGNGGSFYAQSSGSLSVLNSGTVDASFPEPTITPDLGTNAVTVSGDITVVPITDETAGALCQISQSSGGGGELFIGDGNGVCGDDADAIVTGLTVAAGATLVLFDEFSGEGLLVLGNDLVIQGTVTSDLSMGPGRLTIEAAQIFVESAGRITLSATDPDSSGGEIYLGGMGMGVTQTIVNRGAIEAKGNGSGSGGYIYFQPQELVVNYGAIDASGGDDGGSGGEFDAYVEYGDFYSSGTVRMNGGSGPSGGSTEYDNQNYYGNSCYVETASFGNTRTRTGDIIVSGTWEAKGGNGSSGPGGAGGSIYFQTRGMGRITVNADMSVRGGQGAGDENSGGSGGYIEFISSLDGIEANPNPGEIRIGGTYDLGGGNGAQDGGNGGGFSLSSGFNTDGYGPDVEFVGMPVMILNGGQGHDNSFMGYGGEFALYTAWGDASKTITNEADIQAKGGDATLTGGSGGYVYMQKDGSDTQTTLSNSGNMDVSGGSAEMGAAAGEINFEAQHVANAGHLTANGGHGTTAGGGDGGYLSLISDDDATPTANTGLLSVSGGTGTPEGSAGTIVLVGIIF